MKQTWQALKFACESNDLNTIVATLSAAGIKLMNRTIQMSYDEASYRYDIPVFIINDPTSFETRKVEEVVESKQLKVGAPLTQIVLRAHKDFNITVNNKQLCSTLVDELKKQEDCSGKKIQLFYSGKLMEETQPIGTYMKEDGVVTVFLRNLPS